MADYDWNIKERNMVDDTWDGHTDPARCLDWSPDDLEIVDGLQDGAVRRWNPDTIRQLASRINDRDRP
jgi:WD40 repeat protein